MSGLEISNIAGNLKKGYHIVTWLNLLVTYRPISKSWTTSCTGNLKKGYHIVTYGYVLFHTLVCLTLFNKAAHYMYNNCQICLLLTKALGQGLQVTNLLTTYDLKLRPDVKKSTQCHLDKAR